jgi:PTS system mannose-specific IIA component
MGNRTPTGVVVITHGQLATELLNAAEMIVGDLPGFHAVSIGWHDDVTVAHAAIGAAIAKVVVTGVNLAMLIKLAKGAGDADLLTRARQLCEHGRTAIRVASDLLRADMEGAVKAGGKAGGSGAE